MSFHIRMIYCAIVVNIDIVMAIDNGTMFPLARMERGCPQSGRGRGQEIISLFMFITIDWSKGMIL